jgi:hypothetical protein
MGKTTCHLVIPMDLKMRVKATAVLRGLNLSEFLEYALRFTLEAMQEQGFQTAPEPRRGNAVK